MKKKETPVKMLVKTGASSHKKTKKQLHISFKSF
jgi:hypothetical protein